MTRKHNSIVRSQFGAGATDYVTSTAHAQGADLQRIAAVAAIHRPRHALDLGCGGGHVAYAMAPHAEEVTATDLSPEMLAVVETEAARRGLSNIRTICAPAEALPFADASFDMVACRFSAHHWHDVPAGLNEARRVLRPGGQAIFADVIAPPPAAADTHLQAVELLRDPSHVRDYSEAEWSAMLERAGFVTGAVGKGRLRMEFRDWTARMRTSEDRAAAIRILQNLASSDVSSHFAIEEDGSFTIDTIVIEAVSPAAA
ncbi:class I SAM-dependent methyltransferase [Stakelama sediminis]|uniref:Ubiquinone/menaquinone biosynthesis C-methylase UbiE n=1 Tax=Stakelama sediminis TaxID=463200 RepID=A0A840YYD9_9SPHN|nr:class I SAM-dependent methyltransferase [Stakelama sediminis]MBB5718542.1 ubiquinone/menaquinone biosynthesis C-methylase UbiE [Stakelama sediminis]